MSVDLSTGTVSPFGTTRTGPPDLAVDMVASGGQLFVSSYANGGAVLRVDPVTGNGTVVSSPTVGAGPVWGGGRGGISVEAGGTLLLTVGDNSQPNFNGLLTVDPLTGNRAFLSDATHGSGPSYTYLQCVAVTPLLGDANNDGVVNGLDIALVASQWQHAGLFLTGDTNSDGVVNGLDISQIASHWLSTSIATSGAAVSATSVPEPETWLLGLTTILCLWLARRRAKANVLNRRAGVITKNFILVVIMSLICLGGNSPNRAVAAGLAPGEIIATGQISNGYYGLMLIDPATGNRTILSDNTHGSGVQFTSVGGVNVEPDGSLVVVDAGYGDGEPVLDGPAVSARLVRVDPVTGDRTVVSQDFDPAVGAGPYFSQPSFARNYGNELLVSSIQGLISVNPTTGDRAVVSGPTRGSGPTIPIGTGGLQTSGATAFVADVTDGLLKIDLTTGNRTMFSGPGAGAGPTFKSAIDLVPMNGQLYVSSWGDLSQPSDPSAAPGLYRIDPQTGNRETIASATVGTGPFNPGEFGVAAESGGNILMTLGNGAPSELRGLISIDPTTKIRTMVSDATHGTGPTLTEYVSVAVVPLLGDANNDGVVNGLDIALVASQWQHAGLFLTGDTNSDGVVNGLDISQIASHWLSTSIATSGAAVSASSVPEPETWLLGLTTILCLWLARRRANANILSRIAVGITKSRVRLALMSVICLSDSSQDRATAAGLVSGEVVVSGHISGEAALMLIDPATGNRTILSDNAHGSGVPFTNPLGINVEADGSLIVVDAGEGDGTGTLDQTIPSRVFRVDPTTGNRTVVSQDPLFGESGIGVGPSFYLPTFARDYGNGLLVSSDGLMNVDPTTGDRTVVSGASRGSGPLIASLSQAVGVQISGSTAFLGDLRSGLLKVDLATGNRTMFSGPNAGSGPTINSAVDLVPMNGQLYVSSWGIAPTSEYGLYRIDPQTGNRETIASTTVGVGPFNAGEFGVAAEPGGKILMTLGEGQPGDFTGVVAIDPTTKVRTMLSDATHGTGPMLNQFQCVAVVPLLGDANNDGVVNGLDISLVAAQWQHATPFVVGDTNGDGVVNGLDISQIASHWLTASIATSGAAVSATSVPEPATALMAALTMPFLVRWRRALGDVRAG